MTVTTLANTIEAMHNSDERIKSHCWSDKEIAAIPTEDLATMAFKKSGTLAGEFSGSLETFLAFWRAARSGVVRIARSSVVTSGQ